MKPGLSVLGTLNAPKLPRFEAGPTIDGYPWGQRNTSNSNPIYPPDTGSYLIFYASRLLTLTYMTGVTRYYNLHLENGTIAPDGVEMPALLINGQYPAPTITANWGDWIEVQFTNGLSLDTEGTALHW